MLPRVCRWLLVVWALAAVGASAQTSASDREAQAELIRKTAPDALIRISQEALKQMPLYRFHMSKRERIDGKIGAIQEVDVLVRESPLAVRAEWVGGPPKGRRLLYDEKLRAAQMRVREAGFLGAVGAVWIDVDGRLAHGDTRHKITEMPISSLLDQLQRDFEKAAPAGGFAREDLGWDTDGHWCIRYTAPPKAGTYAQKAKICIDADLRIPADVQIDDEHGFLESFRYTHVDPAPQAAADLTLQAAGL